MPKKTYIAAIQEALREEMRNDERVILMGEDVRIGVFAGTRNLHKEFGSERVIDTPISELAVAGAGVDSAVNGIDLVAGLVFGSVFFPLFGQIPSHEGMVLDM